MQYVDKLMSTEKPNQREMLKIPVERVRAFLPKNGTDKQAEDFNLLLQRKYTDSVDECLIQNASLRVRNVCRKSLNTGVHALSWCG